MKVFCLLTFLGGYNVGVQRLFIPEVLEWVLHTLSQMKPLYERKALTTLLHPHVHQELICVFLRLIGNIVHVNIDAQNMLLDNHVYLRAALGFTRLDRD